MTCPVPSTSTADETACDRTVLLVQKLMQQVCGMMYDPCYALKVARAVDLRTIAEVKDFIGRTKVNFRLTGVTGAGVDAEGDATTFVATFPVAPGESIALRTEDWPIPWYAGCLSGVLAFDAGTPETNYQHVIMKAYAGSKGAALTSTDLGYPWNDKEFIYGSELRCGDNCADVPLKSLDCGPGLVGQLSELRLVITNKGTGSNDITRQQLFIRLGYVTPWCCNDCAVNGKGSCGCGK